MFSFRRVSTALCVLLAASICGQSMAQGTLRGRSVPEPRPLAPGVITSITMVASEEDTADGPREFSELLNAIQGLDWQPNYDPKTQTLRDKAAGVTFRRKIWNLEFGFKPLRIIRVDGRLVWYLVYYVRNNGSHPHPLQQADHTYSVQPMDHGVNFIPSFVLQSHGLDRAYRDKVLPRAVERIQQRERPPGRLHDSSNIGLSRIPVSTEREDRRVWGVATWDNIDPRTDFISIYVQGLTNAYRWQPPADGYPNDLSPNQNQENIEFKTLQLNFWRAGDAVNPHEQEIHYGIPLYPDDPQRQDQVLRTYGLQEVAEYQWVYRQPDI